MGANHAGEKKRKKAKITRKIEAGKLRKIVAVGAAKIAEAK